MLESDPYSAQANQLLKEAALAAKMPELALFALETIIAGHSKDIKTMHELAKLYMENDHRGGRTDVRKDPRVFSKRSRSCERWQGRRSG